MARKGVRNHLTSSQRETAEIFATNDVHKMTVEQIADHIGVSKRTIYRWKQDPAFIQYQNEIADRVMDDMLTEAYSTLRRLIREGGSEKTQIEAIKILLQNRGKLKDSPDVVVNVGELRDPQERERKIIEMEKELLGEIIEADSE